MAHELPTDLLRRLVEEHGLSHRAKDSRRPPEQADAARGPFASDLDRLIGDVGAANPSNGYRSQPEPQPDQVYVDPRDSWIVAIRTPEAMKDPSRFRAQGQSQEEQRPTNTVDRPYWRIAAIQTPKAILDDSRFEGQRQSQQPAGGGYRPYGLSHQIAGRGLAAVVTALMVLVVALVLVLHLAW